MTFLIQGIDHVQLAMPPGGEDRARVFYGQVLGLAETAKPANLAGRGGCWFESETIKIHLGVEADFRAARKAHPAIRVLGLAALRERLEASGYLPNTDEPLPGHHRFYVDDPFGNRLEFLEPEA